MTLAANSDAPSPAGSGHAQPAVAVVTPVHNCERYVAEAIESILNQTLGDFELILVEDGSTDGTAAILDDYAARAPRVRVVHRTGRRGAADARNAGIELARAGLVAFQDADDVSAPDWLASQKAYLDDHPELGFVVSPTIRVDIDNNLIGVKRIPYRGDRLVERMQHYCYICHCGALFHTRLVRETGGYRSGLGGAEDYDLLLRLIERAPFDVLDHPVYRHRQVPSGLTHGANDALRWGTDLVRRLARQRAGHGEDDDDYEAAVRAGQPPGTAASSGPAHPAQYQFRLARAALDCGSYRVALRFAWRGVRLRPAWAPGFAGLLVAAAARLALQLTGLLDWFERTFRGR